jgi:hypothetical protein
MPYLFLLLSCLSCLVSGFLLNNAATTSGSERGIRLAMFILSGFLFTVAIALSVAAYTISLHG